MKLPILVNLVSACLLSLAARGASLIIPGTNGSESSYSPTANSEVDLGKARIGNWEDNDPDGNGIYDPNKWAVVFKFKDVTIPPGITVTFKNRPGRPPVVWLVSGNADIGGTVKLSGQDAVLSPAISEPGPGGFRGGMGGYSVGVQAGDGFGIGGGRSSWQFNPPSTGSGAGYGELGKYSGTPLAPLGSSYGNPSLIQLIGGSGGGGANFGRNGEANVSGGAGGGALLLAVSGRLVVNGDILANGGKGTDNCCGPAAAGGSGGGIRIIAGEFSGTGKITAVGGYTYYSPGGVGRIRIERSGNTNGVQFAPSPSVVPLSDGATALLWPSNDIEVRIAAIENATGAVSKSVSPDPQSEFGSVGADVVLPQTSLTRVIVETKGIAPNDTVKVRLTPRDNAPFSEVGAQNPKEVPNSPGVLRWTAEFAAPIGYSAIQAHVVRQ